MYINDIPDVCIHFANIYLFADDARKCSIFYGRNIDHCYKYSLHSAELENTPTIKDLGLIFDPELSFSQHCKEKIN